MLLLLYSTPSPVLPLLCVLFSWENQGQLTQNITSLSSIFSYLPYSSLGQFLTRGFNHIISFYQTYINEPPFFHLYFSDLHQS